jgi:hypothetical protein
MHALNFSIVAIACVFFVQSTKKNRKRKFKKIVQEIIIKKVAVYTTLIWKMAWL